MPDDTYAQWIADVAMKPADQQTMAEQVALTVDAEIKTLCGPTVLSNRVVVQNYGDNSVRLVFAVQFSPNPALPAAFRTAVFLHPSTATELIRQLANIVPLPPGLSKDEDR